MHAYFDEVQSGKKVDHEKMRKNIEESFKKYEMKLDALMAEVLIMFFNYLFETVYS